MLVCYYYYVETSFTTKNIRNKFDKCLNKDFCGNYQNNNYQYLYKKD